MLNTSTIDISEIFKNYIKIEPKVMAIETLFNNQRRFERTNYTPPYQRNYVWSDEKASYFIESILLGTEIPPLIFFNSGELIEVIDGRQRYETIYRFVNNKFKLRSKGLLKLKDLANKNFDALKELKDTIWDTKLRIIEFSFHSQPKTEYDIEDIVKKEIFKRYNTGITPLKSTEIDKAKYIEDDLNSYIKNVLKSDKRIRDLIIKIFYFDNKNIETLLKKIRLLLIQHKVPISYYAANKSEVFTKFYELLSEDISESEIHAVFNNFMRKINLLSEIQNSLEKRSLPSNRLVYECFFWGLSVVENEGIPYSMIDTAKFKKDTTDFISKNIGYYKTDRSLFYYQIFERYEATAQFFQQHLNVSFDNYIMNNEAFKKLNKTSVKVKTDTDALLKFDSLRLNKPDASSNSIVDICRQMVRQRFMVRPIYQRNEVINKNKSSSIIESLLLGIKLPPIFVFKRNDGISEVIDGQQRLLSILGYLGKEYLDENKNIAKSEKDCFALNLQNGILKDLHRKKFNSLDESMKDKILDYNLWVIEIDQKNNPDFDPIDLFIRLNYKPYPIKENTFEMWNSYLDRRLIEYVKTIYNANKHWFYLRKNNSRMENEGLIVNLIYLQHKLGQTKNTIDGVSTFLDTYKSGDKISIRIKSKNDISKIIDSPELFDSFFESCKVFENLFLYKLKSLLFYDQNKADDINERLDNLMNIVQSKRTNQSFYALWLMLANVSVDKITLNRSSVITDLKKIFQGMQKIDSKEQFEKMITTFWAKY